MKKWICFALLLAMLTALPVAAASAPVMTPQQEADMMNAYWDSYILDSDWPALVPEMLEAWYVAYGTELNWNYQRPEGNQLIGLRNYGTHDGCLVLLIPTPIPEERTVEVAGYSFYLSTGFEIKVYCNQAFYGLQEAYDLGLLTKESIFKLSMLHGCYTLDIAYYGEYEGCLVGYVNGSGEGYEEAERVVIIGGQEFCFPDYQPLMVYRQGSMLELSEAYDAGWLTDGALYRLWNYYTNGVYDTNPDTADAVWMPAALMASSGAALILVSKKRFAGAK